MPVASFLFTDHKISCLDRERTKSSRINIHQSLYPGWNIYQYLSVWFKSLYIRYRNCGCFGDTKMRSMGQKEQDEQRSTVWINKIQQKEKMTTKAYRFECLHCGIKAKIPFLVLVSMYITHAFKATFPINSLPMITFAIVSQHLSKRAYFLTQSVCLKV